MLPPTISRNGLCDFRVPGTRKPDRRNVLVDHLWLWLWHNGWDIPKARLRKYTYRQLIGVLNGLSVGQTSPLMYHLLRANGYRPEDRGLSLPPPRAEQQRLNF